MAKETPRSEEELRTILGRHVLGSEKARAGIRDDIGMPEPGSDPSEEETVIEGDITEEAERTAIDAELPGRIAEENAKTSKRPAERSTSCRTRLPKICQARGNKPPAEASKIKKKKNPPHKRRIFFLY